MIGRLLRRRRRATPEDRLDALEAAIDVKLQALLVTATQAIAETVRAELARAREQAGATQAASRGRPPARSLLDVEHEGAERRRALAMLTAPGTTARTERKA
ncbi:MAG: hypothetical protein AB7I59_03735 [Geminicoccaceae bacterium]